MGTPSASPSTSPSQSVSQSPSASISSSASRTPSASVSSSPSASASLEYQDYEISTEQGQPVELLDWSRDTTHWRDTTAAYHVSYGGYTYSSRPGLKVGGIETARNVLRATLEVEAAWSHPLAREFLAEPPDGRIALTVYRGHRGKYATIWRGFLRSVGKRTGRKCLLACTPVASDLGYGGLCLRPGRLCQVPLYSALCGVTEADYTVAGVTESVDGVEVTSPTFATQADGYWVGGNFTALGATRMMIHHSGDTVELSHGISGLAANQAFTASAGCDHTHTICNSRFDNLLNQMAYRFMSNRNPFIEGVL